MSSEAPEYLPVNHVFVDYENIKSVDPSVIGDSNLRVHLFLGPENKTLKVDVVEKLLEHAQTVQMIRSPKQGKNALDFVLAYHLGQAVLTDPKGYFHIISKDAGFDALVDFLKSRKVKVKRHVDWCGLAFQSPPQPAVTSVSQAAAEPKVQTAPKAPVSPKTSATSALSSCVTKLVDNLKKLPKPKRPKKAKGLIAHAKPMCGKDGSETSVLKVLEELKNERIIDVDDKDTVTYYV
jgi:hypothetical protein